jgi:hypothetical protein
MAYNQFDNPAQTVGLTAATAAAVNGVLAAANIALKLLEAKVSFDGATSTNAPAVVQFSRSTFATNAPGTNSTSATPQKRDPGRQETIQATCGNTWTTQPTVLTSQFVMDIGQYNGGYQYIMPQTSPIILPGAKGFVINIISPNNVNSTTCLTCEEG